MTARTAVACGSLALALASAGCLSFYEVVVETPIRAKLDVSSFQRVLVAGFVTGGSRSIDPNTETARLLRSQLRTKSDLKIIDADVIDLVEIYDKQRSKPAPEKPDEVRVKDERDIQDYEAILKDENFWKSIGEEYNNPLIITGSVLFTDVSRSGMVSKLQSYTDSMGRPAYEEKREFANLRGYALTPKFIFIDGRTGAQLYSEGFYEESLYSETQNTPALSSYFELMDKLLPAFLNTLSTQKIQGTRVLLVK
ncbi:MAG TPA: hypothetical protein VFV78_10705 [Vicinamibacterales bacterium]|nr:hypothetical protein [Vicinamibacterales bacterium]